MISAFARMIGPRERLLRVDETDKGLQVTTQRNDGAEVTTVESDGPPPAFVQSLPDDGGTIHVSPLVDALVDWLRKLRAEGTLPHVHEKRE